MSRYLLVAILTLGILGCAPKEGTRPVSQPTVHNFAQENDYIIEALYYQQQGQYDKAWALFDELYKKTGKEEYAVEAARMLVMAHRYKEAEKFLTRLLKRYPKNPDLYRFMTVVQLQQKRYDEGMLYANELLKLQPDNLRNIDLMASINLIKGDLSAAYKLYENYYAKHHDEDSLLKMASILYHKMHKPEEALRLLESHSKMIGCSEKPCLFLAELYRQKGDMDHLADVYSRLYETTQNGEYAQKAAEIYAFLKKYDKAIELLKQSGADDRLLLAIYKHTKKFNAAAALAKRLYDDTADPIWLAEYGILTYEGSKKRNDPKLLKTVIRSLHTAIEHGVDDPLYLNYLGYLLIDHDIDPKWGMELVRKALAQEPNSVYYIDSLAWGYYRLHQCDKAYRQMKRVVDKMGLKDPEIKKHWNAINQCRSRKK